MPDGPISVTVDRKQLAAESQAHNAYDVVPYVSYPYPQAHPDRMAAIATVLGLAPAGVEGCRVLELGCCSGGHLLPMAEALPAASFVGVDASGRQIEQGRRAIEALELTNVELRHANILDLGPELGTFDYVIAHGVYSWVPREVQEKILWLCRELLAPHGVAYVSYNTYPGWRLRGTIRDIMRYRAQRFGSPREQLKQARGLVDFLAEHVTTENNAYGMLLKKELAFLREKEDSYLFHEHLEAVNEPVYFHEFAARAEAAGLRYLAEAEFESTAATNLPKGAESVLNSVATDVVDLEQYVDFLRNRMFRQTLLCQGEQSPASEVMPERLVGLYVGSSAEAEGGQVDLTSREPVTFRTAAAVTRTTEPLVKAAMLVLREAWPQALSFSQLLASARARLGAHTTLVDARQLNAETRRLAEPLTRCFATGQVELRTFAPAFVMEASDRPAAPAYARWQAQSSNAVTNRRHEHVRLDDLQRATLRCLDGTRQRSELVEALAERVVADDLLLHDGAVPVREHERARAYQ